MQDPRTRGKSEVSMAVGQSGNSASDKLSDELDAIDAAASTSGEAEESTETWYRHLWVFVAVVGLVFAGLGSDYAVWVAGAAVVYGGARLITNWIWKST